MENAAKISKFIWKQLGLGHPVYSIEGRSLLPLRLPRRLDGSPNRVGCCSIWPRCPLRLSAGLQIIHQRKELGKNSQALLWKFRIQETRLRMSGKE